MPSLHEDWKKKRIDKKTENYWRTIESKRNLNSWEEYQKKWNFKETDYDYQPSNNGLDMANPAFAFDKKLAKFVITEEKLHG